MSDLLTSSLNPIDQTQQEDETFLTSPTPAPDVAVAESSSNMGSLKQADDDSMRALQDQQKTLARKSLDNKELYKLYPGLQDADETAHGVSDTASVMLNLSYRTGRPLQEVMTNFDEYKAGYAKQNGWDLGMSESGMRSKLNEQFKVEDKKQVALNELFGNVVLKAFQDTNMGKDRPLVGLPTEYVKQWETTHKDLIDGDAGYHAQANRVYTQALKDIDSIRGKAGETFSALMDFTQGKADDARITQVAEHLASSSPEERQKVYRYVGLAAEAGHIDRAGIEQFAINMGKGLSRTFDFVPQGSLQLQEDAFIEMRDTLATGKVWLKSETGTPTLNDVYRPSQGATGSAISIDLRGREATPEEVATLKEQAEAGLKTFGVIRELRNTVKTQVDPIRPVNDEGFLGAAERGAYGLAGSIGIMVPVAINPVLGMMAYQAQEFDRITLENPNMARGAAKGLALLEGAGNAALDRVQLGAINGKLPVFGGLLNGIKNNGIRRVLTTVGVEVLEQNLQEAAQDLIAPLTETLTAALRQDMPDKDFGALMKDYVGSRAETFFAVLPLALIGGGIGTYRDLKNPAMQMADKNLEIAGFGPTQRDYIAKATTPEEKAARIEQEWSKRKESDIKAGEELLAASIAEAKTPQGDTIEVATKEDGTNQWIVRDPAGKEVARVSTEEEAVTIKADRGVAEIQSQANVVADLLDSDWRKDKLPNFEAQFGGEVTPEQLLKDAEAKGDTKMVEAIRASIEAHGNDPAELSKLRILGESWVTPYAEGQYKAFVKLNEGATAQDAFEEIAHNIFDIDLAEGRITKEQAKAWVSQAAAAGVASYKFGNDAEVRESMAQIAQDFAHNKIDQTTLPSSFVAFLKKLYTEFVEFMRRAKLLDQAFTDGKIDAEFERYLSEKIGLSDVTMIEREVSRIEGVDANRQQDLFNDANPEGSYPRTDASFSIRLAAIHKLSEENLAFADKMGGIAVPSIAITKLGSPIAGFGDITLIGGRPLADPKLNPVFDADAYSPRFPRPEFKRVKMSVAQKVVDMFKPFQEQFGNGYGDKATDLVWDNAVNTPNPDTAINGLKRSNVAKATYLALVEGEKLEPVMQPKSQQWGLVGTKAMQAYLAEGNDINKIQYDDLEARKRLGTAITEAMREKHAGQPNDVRNIMMESLRRIVDEDGQAIFGRMAPLERDIQNYGKTEVDPGKTGELLDAKINGKEGKFIDWLQETVGGMFDAPRIKVGGKFEPYTLENITRVMTGGKLVGAEQTMTFGEGNMRAASSTRFSSIEQMRNSAESGLGAEEEIKGIREEISIKMSAWRDKVVELYKYSSTWDALDNSMQAMARFIKSRGKSVADMKKALRAFDFENVSDKVAQDGIDLAREFSNAPVPYFESKPQRIVRLNEFTGAIVGENVSQETLEILSRHGITVELVGADKTSKDPEVAAALAKMSEGVSFSIRARDEAYDAAVKAGDEATQQKLVDEAAKEAGYGSGTYYHGTKEKFTKFLKDKINGRFPYSFGFHFTDRDSEAKIYATSVNRYADARERKSDPLMVDGENIISAKLKTDNPLIIETKQLTASMEADGNRYEIMSQLLEAQKAGKPYDSVIINRVKGDEWDGSNIIVFDPNQIKSADPITRDDAGNVIPLSQRFNPKSNDIRFSIREMAASFKSAQEFGDSLPDSSTLDDRQPNQVDAPYKGAFEVGKFSIDKYGENPYVYENQYINPNDFKDVIGLEGMTWEQVVKMPTTQKYIEWYKDGNVPPPVTVVKKSGGERDGQLQTNNRRRLVAAIEAGTDRIPAVVEIGRRDDIYQESQTSFSIQSQEQIDRVNKAVADTTMFAEGRMALYERAKSRFKVVLAENKEILDALKEGGALPEKIRRAKLLQGIAELEVILRQLPAEVRGKVGGFGVLARGGTGDTFLANFFRDRVRMIDEQLEKYLSKEYDEELYKVFERAKPKKDKPGEKPKGIGADIQDLFAKVKEAQKWTAEEVNAYMASVDSRLDSEDLSAEQEARLTREADLIGLVGGWRNKDSNTKAHALKTLKETWAKGYYNFILKKIQEKEQRQADRDNAIAATGMDGVLAERQEADKKENGWKGKFKKGYFNLISFDQFVSVLFGEKSEIATRLADGERKANAQKEDTTQAKMDEVAEFFAGLAGKDKLKGEQLRWKMSQKSLRPFEGTRWSELEFSETEAVAATMLWMQEDGKRHMEGKYDEGGKPISAWHYTQEFVDLLEKSLSKEAKALRDFLLKKYDTEYDAINKVYKALNGINLPKIENYSPVTVAPINAPAGMAIDPVTGGAMAARGTAPGALRSRGVAIAEPKFQDALQTYIAHTKQMEHWKAYAPFMADANGILRNRDVQNAIEAKGGKEAKAVLNTWTDLFSQGGVRSAEAQLGLSKDISAVGGRAARVALVGRLGTIIIQSTQLGAALAEMPTGSYILRMSKLLSGNLGWKEAFDSPYIQRRLNEMPPIVRQAVEGLRSDRPNVVKASVEKLGRLISGADAIFTAGTYAITYDYHLTQAKNMGIPSPEEYARSVAERAVDKLAQPTRMGARSVIENTSTGLIRNFWAFASESRKNLGLAAYAFHAKDPARIGRTLVSLVILNSLVGNIIRNAWSDARDDDDDEWFDEKHWGMKRLMTSAAVDAIQVRGIPVIGDAIGTGFYDAVNQYHQTGSLINFAGFIRAMKHIPKYVEGDADWEMTFKDIDGILSVGGLFNENIAAAASLSHLANDAFGVTKNAKKEVIGE